MDWESIKPILCIATATSTCGIAGAVLLHVVYQEQVRTHLIVSRNTKSIIIYNMKVKCTKMLQPRRTKLQKLHTQWSVLQTQKCTLANEPGQTITSAALHLQQAQAAKAQTCALGPPCLRVSRPQLQHHCHRISGLSWGHATAC